MSACSRPHAPKPSEQAYNIGNNRELWPHAQRPNGGDMVVGAANSSQPVDFFSFHVVNPCMDQPGCNISTVRPALSHKLDT